MNLHVMISLLALACYAGLLIVVLNHRRQGNPLPWFFSLYLLDMVLVQVGYLMISLANNTQMALWAYTFIVPFACAQYVLYLFLTRSFLGQGVPRKLLGAGLIVAIGSIVIALGFRSSVYPSVYRDPATGLFVPEFGPLALLLGGLMFMFAGPGVFSLLRAHWRMPSHRERMRVQYLLLGFVVWCVGLVINFVSALRPYPIDVLANVIHAMLIAYAILRYQLLDIHIVVRTSLLYALPATVIGGGYFVAVYLGTELFHAFAGRESFVHSFVVALLTAVLARPLWDRAQGWVDKVFFPERYDGALMVQRLSQTAASLLDLDQLAHMIVKEVTGTMHARWAIFLVGREGDGNFYTVAQKGMAAHTDLKLKGDCPILRLLSDQETTINVGDWGDMPGCGAFVGPATEALEKIGGRLWVPLRAGEALVGILIVGPSLSWRGYSRDDELVLTALANQTAVAIDNARLHKKVQESEARYRSLVETSPDAIIVIDMDGKLVMANQRAVELYGCERAEQLLGIDTFQLIVPQERARVAANTRKTLEQGSIRNVEYTMLRRDGIPLHVSLSASVVWGEQGEPVSFIGIVRDITDRVQSEAERERLLHALSHRSLSLQTAAEVSKSAITILDLENLMPRAVSLIQERFGFYYVGIFMVDSAGAYALLRAGTGEAGKRMLAAGHRLAVGGESMIGWSVAHAQARVALDVGEEAVRFDNPHLPLTRSELALPLVVRGEAIGALTVQSTREAAFAEEDITVLQTMADQLATAINNARLFEAAQREIVRRSRAEEKVQKLNAELEKRVVERTAQLQAANKALASFSYSVSHDLRAPLRAINGFSQALLEDYGARFDPQGQDYLRRVRAASQRMGQLIDGLLKLSRLTRGEMHRQKTNLSAMAMEIAAELQEAAPTRQVKFVIAPDVVVEGDAHLLRVVLSNLIGNAWKFTSKRASAKIEFGQTRVDGQVTCFVRDNGAGFDMTYAGKLFGAFQRLHADDEFEGTGIGLATVQRVIHRHGGRVWAEATVDEGATFYFTLAPDADGK